MNLSDTKHIAPTLPPLLRPIPDQFPPLLVRDQRWAPCTFPFDPQRGKYDKIPGLGLTVNDPARWLKFEAARKHYSASLEFKGISYVLTGRQGLVAIDLDHCIVDGQVSEWAAEIVAQAASYAEISPSGTGVHLFVRGQIDSDWTHRLDATTREGVEVYGGASGRHITFTGHRLEGSPEDVQAAPAGFLEWLWERYPRQGRTTRAQLVDMPALEEAPDISTLNLPAGVRDFLTTGESACGDRSRSMAQAGVALYENGLSDGQVLQLLAENEFAMQVALQHRHDDPDSALEYLWKHHCCPYRGHVSAPSPDDFGPGERPAPVAVPEGQDSAPRVSLAPFRGAMAQIVEAALEVAPKQQPELTVYAALAGMAAACPGNYRTVGNLRLNLYVCGVAETGSGKDLPRNLAIEVAKAAGARVIGKPASGQGLEDELQDRIGLLAEVDEIAHMLAAVNGSNAAGYLIELASNMLKLFSASQGTYHTRVRVLARGVPQSRTVEHPCFNLLGFTTPGKLGESVTFANIADGLLGRMLFVFGREDVKPRRVRGRFCMPQQVRAAAERIRQMAGAADLIGDGADITIAEGPGVDQQLQQLLTELDARAVGSTSPFAKSLFVRAFEKVERIAGVLAVWENPDAPVIQREHVAWAHQAVLASDAALLHFAEHFMHEGQVQADAARVLDILRKVLAGGLKGEKPTEAEMLRKGLAPASLVLRRCKLDARRFNEAVSHLVATADVIQGMDGEKARKARFLQLSAV